MPCDKVVVATDCETIVETVAGFGGQPMLTSSDLRNGTERCAAVVDQLGEEPDLVINLQGDSPLVPPEVIWALVGHMAGSKDGCDMATPFVNCDKALRDRLLGDAAKGVVGGTCVVADRQGRALYFSKRPIPYGAGMGVPLRLHLGIYAYRPEALRRYLRWEPGVLEEAEGLEQLRFLENGGTIELVEVELPKRQIWEVNNPQDVSVVEPMLPVAPAST